MSILELAELSSRSARAVAYYHELVSLGWSVSWSVDQCAYVCARNGFTLPSSQRLRHLLMVARGLDGLPYQPRWSPSLNLPNEEYLRYE